MLKYSSWTGNNMVRKSALEKALESGCVSHRNHRYAFFLRLAYEEIILRQYSRNLIFDVLAVQRYIACYILCLINPGQDFFI